MNSLSLHWQISVAADGTLFFATDGVGDIYYSTLFGGRYFRPVKADNEINTEMTECCPFISAAGALLLFTRSTSHDGADLYASFRLPDGSWAKAVNLGSDVNTTRHELCPIVSPDGEYLFFISNRDGESAVYWVDIQVVNRLRRRK